MTFRERVEAQPVGWLVGVGAASFLAGVFVTLGAMQVIISDRGPRIVKDATEPSRAPTSQPSPGSTAAKPADSGNMEMTSQQFIRRYMTLDGRFSEQEAFIKRADGKRVRWQVVFTHPTTVGNTVGAYFDVRPESPNAPALDRSPVGWALFPISFRDRLYSLKRGDVIEITGVLRIFSNDRLQIDGDDFDIVSTPTPTSSPAH